MQFYTSISQLYRYIFPYNKAQLAFTKSFLGEKTNLNILDVGCGIGDLSRAFAREGWKVDAIDNDMEMIEMANSYTKGNELVPEFHHMDMCTIADNFHDNKYHAVCCFGNSLVHLLNEEDIEVFIFGAAKLLKTKGVFALQILNYDYILDNQVKTLPLIDNEFISFQRTYVFRKDGLIDFNTLLLDKNTNMLIENSIVLNPIRKDDIIDILIDAGFEDIEVFGDFKKGVLQPKSLPLVIKAINRN